MHVSIVSLFYFQTSYHVGLMQRLREIKKPLKLTNNLIYLAHLVHE